jgi:hypothetical protein
MVMQAQLADGRVLEFPDGTDPAVIQSTVKRVVSQQAPQGEVSNDIPIDNAGDSGSLLGDAGRAGLGALETAATIGTGAIAEPLAGIAGIAQTLNPLADEGAGARAVEATREALTFQPRTESGQSQLQAVGETLEPVAKAVESSETFLGDKTLEITGSPTLAALATTLPTLALELIGAAAGKTAVKVAANNKASAIKGNIIKEIGEAAPSIDQLKDTSRAVYKEIDDLGARVNKNAYRRLTSEITRDARKFGLDKDITPKASKALARFNDIRGRDVSLTEIDTLRKVAQNAASSLEPAEAALGARMIESVDSFLDNVKPSALAAPEGAAVKDIGARYKAARNLWGRARKSELVQESFEKARNQASGFENGVRTQFRQILNNKKKSRFFNAEEKAAMKRVVVGDSKENIAKLIGRLGFSEGSATNILGGAVGATAGAAAFGAPGAVIVPLIGQVSRKLAQRMTAKNAQFADQVIRAGKDAEKITAAYLKNTPKAARSAEDLSQLLLRPDIDLSALTKTPLMQKAASLAQRNREAAGALEGALITAPQQSQGEQ